MENSFAFPSYLPKSLIRNCTCDYFIPRKNILLLSGVTDNSKLVFRNACQVHASLSQCLRQSMGRDSSVGIATRYGLDGPEIESWWRWNFLHLSRPALGPTQLPVQWVTGLSPGVKRPGRGVDHPPPSSAEVNWRVELYLFSPSGPSWPVLEWTLPLPLPLPEAE